jgi:hypothetical protein
MSWILHLNQSSFQTKYLPVISVGSSSLEPPEYLPTKGDFDNIKGKLVNYEAATFWHQKKTKLIIWTPILLSDLGISLWKHRLFLYNQIVIMTTPLLISTNCWFLKGSKALVNYISSKVFLGNWKAIMSGYPISNTQNKLACDKKMVYGFILLTEHKLRTSLPTSFNQINFIIKKILTNHRNI